MSVLSNLLSIWARTSALLFLGFVSSLSWGGEGPCKDLFLEVVRPKEHVLPTKSLKLEMGNIKVASVQDSTQSTGATLFYFPEGATIAVDARGGSVASSETTLFAPGSYDAKVDGLVFSGGSTLGLASGDGVRKAIYDARSGGASAFDAIASVPTAVVYDFGGRVLPHNDPLVTPDHNLGKKLYDNLGDTFPIGRAGAGTSTTANKILENGGRVFGGQGAAVVETPYGKVFASVALNPHGNVFSEAGEGVHDWLKGKAWKALSADEDSATPGKNTTLSMVAFEADLDRNQLQRMATTVHTSMAESIRPFQTYTDGDVHFSLSLHQRALPDGDRFAMEETLQNAARQAMKQAIEASISTANKPVKVLDSMPSSVSRRWDVGAENQDTLNVSSVQWGMTYGMRQDQFLAKAEAMIVEAQAAGNDLIVFPELFVYDLLRFGENESRAFARMAQSGQSTELKNAIHELARRHQITILAGSMPVEENGKIFNRSHMLFPDGKEIYQDKIQLTGDEADWGWSASNEIKVFDLPWGRSAILICYDSEFPTISAKLFEASPEMLFVPSMTSDKGLQRVLRSSSARSIEHHNYTVVSGITDPRRPHLFSAQATHFFPSDTAFPVGVHQGELNEAGLVNQSWDLRNLRESRENTRFWPGKPKANR